MNIAIFGTGYVGLVTGVCLSDIGHRVTCIDIDENKVAKMKEGISPIYEPGLDELMSKNINENRLLFTTDCRQGIEEADVIYIAVGTPQQADGSANLQYIEQVALDIANNLKKDSIVVIKSTVPVGTNDHVKNLIQQNLKADVKISMVSNPEFLREGSAIHDSFYGDRIVIGADDAKTTDIMEEVNKPFNVPVFKTTIRSSEMIKYAANAFLATKISFINEIANICEKLGADVEHVANGMGLDKRIGTQFLKAGIGYGGSCFPKDTHALIQIAGNVEHDFDLLKSVITVNNSQQASLVGKIKNVLGDMEGKQVAMLGLAFKPNTDDMREAASIVIANDLVKMGAKVVAYDPIATENAKRILPNEVQYVYSVEGAVKNADVVLIVTEWDEIKEFPMEQYVDLMKQPIIFDGRNCHGLEYVKKFCNYSA
ncbi:UDP-glucose dehydrogenase family protein [Bacillus thuringiensis serovar darmstadiensis]|uniref:UDP-glucose dehydrogenase family protein n=1 Tax=Bacillus thuringiensis TaxID=1428 RepID=UPI000A3D3D46|nr:UDP-glucose/GDP-mannose dehydrogenase family protein [Bacillus thuringiensis]MED2124578.1 UDP-glucose/GDP-mannose dehydrogenase family protein [Bacillus thuringiensis]MED3506440.1 UDP-glucose/GDP-mannose dehydrogenase family protein [Bacillus thuringiensis]MRA69048.1 nucleotide sugar dehydrogenase [Bacillus thuringiensis]OTZ89696.1 UDP-glucose 6-dehydrogenase [Bacillus thuringiensis serovar darmstadiensis]